MTDLAAVPDPVAPPVSAVPRPAVVIDRCARTGITKPECHCPACLAAMMATHHRPSAAA